MALRRLLSGWLIAVAALARSLAQALERASEDRSAPATDPLMAALAERYPGAPAHWLAHVAERTSQLADAGEAPLSLNSDPTAWPPVQPDGRPGGLTPLLATPPAPTEPAPATLEPAPARPTPRRDTAVPTLAALRDRPSEVWSRPEIEPRRRPRPVFAALGSAPTSERSTRPAAPETGSPPRRPRSPLTVVGSPSPTASGAPEFATTSDTPMPDTSASTAPPREATWSEAPPSRATSAATKIQPHIPGATERSPAAPAPAFAPARSKDMSGLPPETPKDRVGPPPARRQRSWFFAKSAPARRSLELSADPGRPARSDRAGETFATAADPASAARVPLQLSTSHHQTVSPDHARLAEVRLAQTPPAPRRSIFQALAALRAKPGSRAGRLPVSEPAVAKTPPTAVQSAPDPRPRRSGPSFTPPQALASAGATPIFSATDQGQDGPPNPAKVDTIPRVARRIVREAFSTSTSEGGTQALSGRPSFSTPRPPPSRTVARHPAGSPSDDRWPALPPSTFAAPAGVEALPPRWDQLAREQEEGRWSV